MPDSVTLAPWNLMLVALAFGIALGWLLSQRTRAELREYRARLERQDAVEAEAREASERLNDLQAELRTVEAERAVLRESVRTAEERLQEARDVQAKAAERATALQERVERGAEESRALAEQLASIRSSERLREQRLAELTKEHAVLQVSFRELDETHHALKRRLESERAEFEEKQRGFEEKMSLLQQTEKQLTQQFENLANRIFEEKGNAFKTVNQESLERLLKPFQDNLQGLHRDVREASKERHTLSREIERIVTEANALTQALRGDSKVQGDWGEMVLARVLESTGLRRGEEYEVQRSYETDAGRLRPDAIIHLPENRNVVIDAKVSLTAYTNYSAAEDETTRRAHLAAHVESMKKHIRDLAERRYDHIESIQSVDFTLMFVPVEPAYFAALQDDPALVTFAMERRVVIVSPTTLFATLKTIERIWIYERQNQNTQKIVKQATSLYDKLCSYIESMEALGRALARADESYDQARKRLIDGRGNVISQAAKLKDLGLNTKKSLPNELVEVAQEQDEDAPAALASESEPAED